MQQGKSICLGSECPPLWKSLCTSLLYLQFGKWRFWKISQSWPLCSFWRFHKSQTHATFCSIFFSQDISFMQISSSSWGSWRTLLLVAGVSILSSSKTWRKFPIRSCFYIQCETEVHEKVKSTKWFNLQKNWFSLHLPFKVLLMYMLYN